ncbi:MAG: hypothetical protein ACPG5B_02910 [Chitinophagales bacterium]
MINLKHTFRSQAHLDSVVKEYYKKIGSWVEEKICLSLEANEDNGLLKFIKCNLKTIIAGKPDELIEFYEEIKKKNFDDIVFIRKNNKKERKKGKAGKKETVTKFLKYAFDYDKFRNEDAGKWWAEQLNIKTCVYCNTQFAHVLKLENAKIKRTYQIDHFFPQVDYPYFALSFYNLIPSCGTCNGGKGDNNVNADFHPYKFDFDKEAVFSVDEESVIDFILGSDQTKLEIDIKPRSEKDKKDIEAYVDDFKLKEVYANHTDIVTELYQKKYHYPESRKQEISNLLAGAGERLTPEEITRMLRGSYIEREKILQRPLSKLIKDISDELDLI